MYVKTDFGTYIGSIYSIFWKLLFGWYKELYFHLSWYIFIHLHFRCTILLSHIIQCYLFLITEERREKRCEELTINMCSKNFMRIKELIYCDPLIENNPIKRGGDAWGRIILQLIDKFSQDKDKHKLTSKINRSMLQIHLISFILKKNSYKCKNIIWKQVN